MTDLSPKARRLIRERERKAESPIEANLGEALERMGMPFVRQEPIGPYFADIFIPPMRAVVECDGAQHADQAEHDARRDEYMRRLGYVVFRLSGSFINADPGQAAEWLIGQLAPPRHGDAMRAMPEVGGEHQCQDGSGGCYECARIEAMGRGKRLRFDDWELSREAEDEGVEEGMR